jgi:hypothetical protein
MYYEVAFDHVIESMSALYATLVTYEGNVIKLYRDRANNRRFNELYEFPNVYPNAMIMFLVDLTRVN